VLFITNMKTKTIKEKLNEKPGWIKIHRKMLDWEWYDDLNVWKIFMHCLLIANFKDKKWHGRIIKRGSFITSSIKLAKEVCLGRQQTRTALNKLKSTNEITIKTTSKYTEITVNNYDSYQQNNQQSNQRVTSDQPASNQQVTTTKEGKEGKNDNNKRDLTVKKKKYSSLKDIGEVEFQQVADFYKVPLAFVRSCYDDLVNYCGAHGKVYKNYYLALRNFAKKDAIKIRKEVSERVSKRGIDARGIK